MSSHFSKSASLKRISKLKTLSLPLALVLCATVALPAHVLAADAPTPINSDEFQKPVGVYAGYDGSSSSNPVLYYLLESSGPEAVTGTIAQGGEDAFAVVQNWDDATDSFTASTGDLHISGLKATRDATSSVDVTLYLTRQIDSSLQNQRLYVIGLDVDNGTQVVNTGDITIAARGNASDNNDMVYAETTAYGIKGDIQKNEGTIKVSAEQNTSSDQTTETLFDTDATAYGIRGDVGESTKEASITVVAKGGNATSHAAYSNAKAYGIWGAIGTNESEITVTAVSGTTSSLGTADKPTSIANSSALAIGIRSVASSSTNTGNITARAFGGVAQASGPHPNSVNSSASATAFGLQGSFLHNSGDINVYAKGGTASSSVSSNIGAVANAYGIVGATSELTNSGHISVVAEAGTTSIGGAAPTQEHTRAIGISLGGDLTLHSSGLIDVEVIGDITKSEVYQVYTGSNSLTITGYAMRFGNDPKLEDYENVISGDPGSSITLQQTKLYAHTTDDTLEGEAYTLPVLVEGMTLFDSGQFEDIETVSATGAGWNAQFVEGTQNTANQQVIFSYTPQASTPQLATSQRHSVTSKMQGVVQGNMLATMNQFTGNKPQKSALLSFGAPSAVQQAHGEVPDILLGSGFETTGQIYATPFHSIANAASDPMGYHATTTGLIAGYNHMLRPDLLVGVTGAYASSSLDYSGAGYDERSEDVDLFSFGAQAAYRWNDFLLSGLAAYSYSSNEYRDNDPANLETADYDTRGFESHISLQYIMEQDYGLLVPELGLSHLWFGRNSYTTNNQVAAETTYGSLSDHELDLDAKLSWHGEFEVRGLTLRPYVSAGIRQTLTDGSIDGSMRSGSNGFAVVESEQDRTFGTAAASLDLSGNSFNASLGYVGEYSKNTNDSTLFGRISYRF